MCIILAQSHSAQKNGEQRRNLRSPSWGDRDSASLKKIIVIKNIAYLYFNRSCIICFYYTMRGRWLEGSPIRQSIIIAFIHIYKAFRYRCIISRGILREHGNRFLESGSSSHTYIRIWATIQPYSYKKPNQRIRG